MSALTVPTFDADVDTLTAALAYAKAGWYVLPVDPAGKHAGSVVGTGWPAKSSREPDQIVAWFAGSNYALALHVGRSGAVALDVDDPDARPAVLLEALAACPPPFQSTRHDQPGRGHALYAVPPARDLGNSGGKLGGAWGEVRGRNGIIVVFPTVHSKAAAGGRYCWARTGPLPALPAALAELLPDALSVDDAATDAEVAAFLLEHSCDEHPGLLRAVVARFEAKVAAGASRHATAQGSLVWGMKEARVGLYPAADVRDQLRAAFLDSLALPCGKEGPRRQTPGEFAGMLAWAVAQARASNPDEVRRIADKQLSKQAAERDWLEDLTASPSPAADQSSPVDTDLEALAVDARYPVLDWAEVFSNAHTEASWLAEPLLEAGRVVALYSPPKLGKSLLALELAAALSAGRPVLGNPARAPIVVLYVDLENTTDDIRERLEDLGYAPQDLPNLRYLSFPDLPALDSEKGGAHLLRIARRHDAALIVVDTVSRVIDGKEDLGDTFRALYRHAVMPLKREGRTVLRLDHAGKDLTKGQRGSSAKNDDVDAVWVLTKRGADQVDLRRTHSRTNHGVDVVQLKRLAGPLRHVPTSSGSTSEVQDLAAHLDRLEVPTQAGRTVARKALTDAGLKATNGVLEEVLRHRKRAEYLPAGRSGQPEDSTPAQPARAPARAEDDSRSKTCPGQATGSSGSHPQVPLTDLPAPLSLHERGRSSVPESADLDEDLCELCAEPATHLDGERFPYCATCRAGAEQLTSGRARAAS